MKTTPNYTFAVRREYAQRTDVQHANRRTDGRQRTDERSVTDRRMDEQANNTQTNRWTDGQQRPTRGRTDRRTD